MILIYTPKITNRIRYAFNLIFKDILKVDYNITTDLETYKNHNSTSINYSLHRIREKEVYIHQRNLLIETGLTEQTVLVHDLNGCKYFFATVNTAHLPFDVFAASFFMASRYEEYLPHIRDHYDRFDAKESIAYKNNFLTKPIVNYWSDLLKNKIKEEFPDELFPELKFKYTPTIDIDNAYAFKEKGAIRTIAGFSKSLLSFNFKELKKRTQVILGKEKDPYDTYDFQLKTQKKYNLKPVYFFLLGDYDENDKNIAVDRKNFQSLIKKISDYADVGIHPSFASNNNSDQLKVEVNRLSHVLNREITKSRQHFLKLRLPDTYRNLIDLDITDDYTMGFASQIGFRAGLCTPFRFYDLDMELETRLIIHPFAIMEGTLKYYMKVDADEAMEYIKPLMDEVKKVNGEFMSLWHNDTLNDQGLWEGWRSVYEEMIKYSQIPIHPSVRASLT